jgi:TPR repeat protein
MKFLIGILAVFAMLHGEALACKDRSAQNDAVPKRVPKASESPEAMALYEQAAALEGKGKGAEAMKTYRRAARAGSARAAKRLGEIYEKGGKGVEPNYQESQKWYLAARSMGEDIPLAKCR